MKMEFSEFVHYTKNREWVPIMCPRYKNVTDDQVYVGLGCSWNVTRSLIFCITWLIWFPMIWLFGGSWKYIKYYTLLGFSQQNLVLKTLLNILEENVFYFFHSSVSFQQSLVPRRWSRLGKECQRKKTGSRPRGAWGLSGSTNFSSIEK